MPSAPERRRPRRATFLALAAFATTGAIAIACGIDAVATRDGASPGGPDTGDDRVVVLPPEGGPVSDATADVVVDAEAGCPTGHGRMVEVHDAGGLSFCIDSTEVTNGEFQKFVDATSKPDSGFDAGAVDGCAAAPATFLQVGGADLPAAQLSWCGARAYCLWAGKRLCGKADPTDASSGEWYAACSNGNTRAYPYGSTRINGACNDMSGGATSTNGHPQCEGGLPGIYDMVGNVAELTDNCTTIGADTRCVAAGGYYSTAGSTCATVNQVAKISPADFIGFRCCADLD